MPTYRLDLEYEGTRYSGWQEQINSRSVAGELRRAVEAAGSHVVDLGGSGRTDAGVHALQQVAHLRLDAAIEPERFMRAVNGELPADIHVVGVLPATERFHARHAALRRTYLYQISTRRSAFAKRWVWWVRDPLDVEAMRATAERLRGRHDFSRFCARPGEQTSTIAVVECVEIARESDLILVRLTASHFIWRMVRRLVGALVEVGAGRLAADEFSALLQGTGKASPAKWTAPPSGLFLERVEYPGEPALAPLRALLPLSAFGPPARRFTGDGKGSPRTAPGRPRRGFRR